ncbi:MAG TPA: DJ-1/PfpI family protein [Pseudonocardiaceae bacterium]|jgi:transcriptional regulator GlxA family with amidase domain
MQIAILLFDRVTTLDAIGPYQVFTNLPDSEVVFVGERTGLIRGESNGIGLMVDAELADVPNPDLVLVPGGAGQNDHMDDGPVHQWLRAADKTATWMTSVCTGSLILAAAGLLDGRKATSHWLAVDTLAQYGAIPTRERVVMDGKYVTGAGVSAGIDMALSLTATIAGEEFAQRVQLGIEYDPQPPFNAGSPNTAPEEIVGFARSKSRFILQSS